MRVITILHAALAIVLAACLAAQADESNRGCFTVLMADDLPSFAKDIGPLTVDMGDGVVFRLMPGGDDGKLLGPRGSWMSLTVMDQGRPVREFAPSYFIAHAKVQSGRVLYWLIDEYSGGAHCCARFHFFAKSADSPTLRYLGATEGTSLPAEEPFLCLDGVLHFEDTDIRFEYFHTSYATSELYIPCFYRLDARSISVANRSFRERYRKAAEEVDAEIREVLKNRRGKPSALISRGNGHFTDRLGQLLVKRAILRLYARDDTMAWKELNRDISRRYRSTGGTKLIKNEIVVILKKGAH